MQRCSISQSIRLTLLLMRHPKDCWQSISPHCTICGAIRSRTTVYIFQPHETDQMSGCHWTSQVHEGTFHLDINDCLTS